MVNRAIKHIFLLVLVVCVHQVWGQENKDIFTPNKLTPMYQNNVLIEVFTSEGCGSCPMADAFMKDVIHLSDSTKTPVYVVDYHVDYWNRSGWIDPFSDSIYTDRQIALCKQKNEPKMFTPMAFVNGGKALSGSDKKSVGIQITQQLAKPNPNFLKIDVGAIPGEDSLIVGYKIWGPTDSLEFFAALVQTEIKNSVTAGENKEKILEHHNVCRQLQHIPIVQDKGQLKLFIPQTINLDNYRLIGFAQHKGNLQIRGVDQLTFKP